MKHFNTEYLVTASDYRELLEALKEAQAAWESWESCDECNDCEEGCDCPSCEALTLEDMRWLSARVDSEYFWGDWNYPVLIKALEEHLLSA